LFGVIELTYGYESLLRSLNNLHSISIRRQNVKGIFIVGRWLQEGVRWCVAGGACLFWLIECGDWGEMG